jgi:hypothetical protein
MLSSWCPMIHETFMGRLRSRVLEMMIVMRSISLGCFRCGWPCRVWRSTRCIAALLSTIHLNLHRCHLFHDLDSVISRRSAEA